MNYSIAPLCEILNDFVQNFLRYSEKSWVYIDFYHSFGRGMLFYLSDQSKIYQKYRNHYSAPLCEILNYSIKNFLRYIEISWFYVDFTHSFGRGISSTKAINLIFKRNRAIIIIHNPTKFHWNRSRTFWDNLTTHTDRHIHTHPDTYTRTKIIPVQKQSFWASLLNLLYFFPFVLKLFIKNVFN